MGMTRELRPGARYHVTLQADERLLNGKNVLAREIFLNSLERARTRYAFRVDIFCMLGNRFHLVLRPAEGESLSRIMQWIMAVYAQAFHRACGSCGHVWDRRFESKIIA